MVVLVHSHNKSLKRSEEKGKPVCYVVFATINTFVLNLEICKKVQSICLKQRILQKDFTYLLNLRCYTETIYDNARSWLH